MPRFAKLLGALFLLVSLALPFGSCSHYEDAQGNLIELADGEEPPQGAVEEVTYVYVLEDFDAADTQSWWTIIGFVWPVFMILLLYRWDTGRKAVFLRVVELLLCVLTGFVIYMNLLFSDQLEIGAFVAIAGLLVYTLTAGLESLKRVHTWRRKRAGFIT